MIETSRLILRPLLLADFKPWYAMLSDRRLFRFIAVPAMSREDGWNRLLRYAGQWSLLGFGMFAVPKGKRFDDAPETAWILSRSAQGRGFGSEAVAAAHQWLAQQRRASARTVCIISLENAPSLRLAHKLDCKPFDRCIDKGAPCCSSAGLAAARSPAAAAPPPSMTGSVAARSRAAAAAATPRSA